MKNYQDRIMIRNKTSTDIFWNRFYRGGAFQLSIGRIMTLVLLFMINFSSCNNVSNSHASDKAEQQGHWSYDGETSPEHWAEIERNSDCSGKEQSPVNIIDDNTIANHMEQSTLRNLYGPRTKLSGVKNNGHSIQFDFESGDSIIYDNEIY